MDTPMSDNLEGRAMTAEGVYIFKETTFFLTA